MRCAALVLLLACGCSGPMGPAGAPCTVAHDVPSLGSDTITCGATSVVVSNGKSASVTPEPAGENCPTGGVKVQGASEQAIYVCNGADGRSVTVQPEPAGPNCPNGGVKVQGPSGTAAYVCGSASQTPCTTLEGSLTIANSQDWRSFVETGCTEITGDLRIEGNGLADLDGVALVERIGGELSITRTDALTSVALPKLTTVGTLTVAGNDALSSLSLPALTKMGSFVIASNKALASLSLPKLTTAADGIGNMMTSGIMDNAALAHLDFPRLTTVGSRLMISYNLQLPSLAGFSTLTTVGGDLYVVGNAGLTTLGLPVLTDVRGNLVIQDNATLPQCQAVALQARLVANGWTGAATICGNDATATCP